MTEHEFNWMQYYSELSLAFKVLSFAMPDPEAEFGLTNRQAKILELISAEINQARTKISLSE